MPILQEYSDIYFWYLIRTKNLMISLSIDYFHYYMTYRWLQCDWLRAGQFIINFLYLFIPSDTEQMHDRMKIRAILIALHLIFENSFKLYLPYADHSPHAKCKQFT